MVNAIDIGPSSAYHSGAVGTLVPGGSVGPPVAAPVDDVDGVPVLLGEPVVDGASDMVAGALALDPAPAPCVWVGGADADAPTLGPEPEADPPAPPARAREEPDML